MKSLRTVVVPVLVVAAVCVVVAALVRGAEGAAGAALAGLLVALFLTAGLPTLEPVAKSDPTVSLLVAMTLFTGKVALVIVVLAVFLNTPSLSERVDAQSLGLTVVATSLVSTTLQVLQYRRKREPLYDLGDDG